MTWVHLANQTATASDLRRNFQHVRLGDLLPLGGVQSFASTNGDFDLGASTVRWSGLYLSRTSYVGGTLTVNDGNVTTMTVSGTDISVSSIALAPGVLVIESSTSDYIGGNVLYNGTRYPYFVKELVGQFINTVTYSQVAHGITNGSEVIIRAHVLYHGTTRTYQDIASLFTTTGASAVARWDDTYFYLGGAGIGDATTVTVVVMYAPGIGMDIV